MNRQRNKSNANLGTILIIVFLVLYCIFLYGPFLWGLLASFKNGTHELDNNMFGLPEKWKFKNYLDILTNLKIQYVDVDNLKTFEYNFAEMMGNSFIYSFVTSLVQTVCIYIMAYARGRYNFKFNKIIDIIVLISITLPIVGSLPSSIELFTKLNLIDNFFGIAVIAKFGFLTMYYFIVATTIRGIPKSYIEAAEIDGANEFKIFARIVFPLTFSIFFTVFIFNFIGAWNDWQTPYIYLKNMPTISYGLWYFKNSTTSTANLVYQIGACFLVAIPVILIFLVFHKRLMGGISISEGVKE